MNDLIIGILLGLLGFGIISGLLVTAFYLGARQNRPSTKKSGAPSSPSPQKRRVPTSGTTIPKGGIAQTQFPVSSFPNDSSDPD
ncbi:MAG: hypothetical protein GX331_09825 [Firmicutes bacterium]|jgi:hypothetical protein|nr:hypothetical protein [Bacillota bacterium]